MKREDFIFGIPWHRLLANFESKFQHVLMHGISIVHFYLILVFKLLCVIPNEAACNKKACMGMKSLKIEQQNIATTKLTAKRENE